MRREPQSEKIGVLVSKILPFTLFGIVLIATALPYLIWGEAAYVTIHDQLDSLFTTNLALSRSDQIFAPSDEVMAQYGVPRICFGTEYFYMVWLYRVLDPFVAYVSNLLFIKIVAYWSMASLLNLLLSPQIQRFRWISFGVAACFASLPFYSLAGLSVAGLPLLALILLRIERGQDHWYDWVGLLLFPLFSNFVYAPLFFIALLWGYWCVKVLLRRRLQGLRFLVGSFVLLGAYLLVEYRLVSNVFAPSFLPHRVEFDTDGISLKESLAIAWKNFIDGQYHVETHHLFIVIPAVVLALLAIGIEKFRSESGKPKGWIDLGIFVLLGGIALISLWYGVWDSTAMHSIRRNVPMADTLNWSRFHWLHPLLWYSLFALALVKIAYSLRWKYAAAVLILAQLYLLLFVKNEDRVTRNTQGISFREFFADDLYADIREYIGKPQSEYRVVSVGLYPSIASYHGFYVADFYMNYYPVEYKRKFREIIAEELSRSQFFTDYYDNWGSRVYAFSVELEGDLVGFSRRRREPNRVGKIEKLLFSTDAMKKMNVQYIFSRVEILDDKFKLEKVFNSHESIWSVYLYSINDKKAGLE